MPRGHSHTRLTGKASSYFSVLSGCRELFRALFTPPISMQLTFMGLGLLDEPYLPKKKDGKSVLLANKRVGSDA